jgi:hypothetical protein
METRSGSTYVWTSSTQVGSLDLSEWFCVELHWKLGASDGGGTLWVNGVQIYEVTNADTDNYGSFSALRVGLAEMTNVGSTTLYSDSVVVGTSYIGLGGTPPVLYVLQIAVSGQGSTSPAVGSHYYGAGANVQVTGIADSGWELDHWILDSVNVGDVNPYTVTMSSNHSLTAVFVEVPVVYYTLVIGVSGSGSTSPAPGTYSYLQGTVVQVDALPNAGQVLSYWLLNGTNVGSADPYTVTMSQSRGLTAVFVAAPRYYTLVIGVSGSGSTSPAPGTYSYLQGTVVQVDALPNAGQVLSYWLLNGTNVGSADPYTVTMSQSRGLTAVFVAAPTSLFSDGFESGSFSKWSGPSVTSGETATVVGTLPHHGTYGARFTSNAGGGFESAYVYKSIASSELYVRGYFNIANGLPLQDTDDRFNLLALQSGTSYTIASAGVRRSGGVDRWSITSSAGTWLASVGPSMDHWYCVEFYAKIASSGGIFRMWVDGVLVLEQTGLNTASVGTIAQVRTGLTYVSGVTSSLEVYGDCYVMSNNYIGTE